MQLAQGTATLGEHEAARRFAIEPMNEFQIPDIGPRVAQEFNSTESDATPAVDGEARGFIDDEQLLVFIDQPVKQALCQVLWRCVRIDPHAHRR